ncbi:MAG: DUF1127 domain-containing protein [Gammaproteobacteria bacterium]
MNQATYLNCYIRSQKSDPAISATRLLARIWRTLHTWRQTSASRHALARLSPRLMRDAGIWKRSDLSSLKSRSGGSSHAQPSTR